MASRAHFADELTPGFRKIYVDAYEEEAMHLSDIFHVEESEKDSEKDSYLTGFGLASETAEQGPVSYEDPVQGYDKTYSHLKYTKGFKVTLEMWEDGLYRSMKRLPEALGRCMRRTAEDLASQVFNRAFNSSYADGPDAKVLCSTSHTRPDGGTAQSNSSSTSIRFTEDNLKTARIAFRKQLDDKGQKIAPLPRTILVPVDLEQDADLIVGSEKRSGTADNDKNFNKGKYSVIDWEYLSSTTAWFLLDKQNHRLNWFWRRKPSLKNDELFDTEVAVYKSTMRASRGWSHWIGTWGSQGDASAYSN